MDKRDEALQRSCPTISAPRYSALESVQSNGERIVLAKNGVFLEVRRSWAHFIRKVGDLNVVVPFGEISEQTTLTMPSIPRALIAEFISWAQEDAGIEIGANIVWSEGTGQFRLVRSESIDAGPGHLKYRIPPLDIQDHIIVDCHSHSSFSAFFSAEDNRDDAHAVKFAFVVGNCNSNKPSTAMRLCVKGVFTDIDTRPFIS